MHDIIMSKNLNVLLNGNAIEIYNKKHHKNLKNIGKF